MKAPTNDDCENLNRRFGAPGRIVFRPSDDTGMPVVVLANKYGTAEIDLRGAHVLSYRPTGQMPVFYLPKVMKVAPDAWSHGGVPVCWPWFGRSGEPGSAGHGFAWRLGFNVQGSEYSEDANEITLFAESDDVTRALWPHDFRLEVKISVSMSLNLTLTAKNTGAEKFWYTEGFHPYFRVNAATSPSVRGLDGAKFCNAEVLEKCSAADFRETWRGDLAVDHSYDHVFSAPDGEYALFDPGLKRTIVIRSRGNKKCVVWRPKADDCHGNMAGEDPANMVCVEPATLFRDEGAWLEPGETHQLRVAVQSDPNDGSVHARN